jgi:dolichol-phosphate mannosyltransferase
VEITLIDDGSTDATATALEAWTDARVRCIRHPNNRGLTAALATGLDHSRGAIVCWLDADLSYDAALLPRLVAMVRAGADLALVSPYHPDGRVEGISAGRLLLSKGVSWLYRWFVHADLHTFSSMVRAWRRELLEECRPRRGGYLGVTETLLLALARGASVAELPAVLRARQRGTSKLRVLPVLLGHIGLLRDASLGTLVPAPRSQNTQHRG